MARPITRYLLPLTALLALCALFVWLFPRNTLSVLTADEGTEPVLALSMTPDGQYRSDPIIDGWRDLLPALEDSVCVPLPGLRANVSADDICLYCGGVYAVFSPTGAYLYSGDGLRGCYVIMGAGPELYQRVQSLISVRA